MLYNNRTITRATPVRKSRATEIFTRKYYLDLVGHIYEALYASRGV